MCGEGAAKKKKKEKRDDGERDGDEQPVRKSRRDKQTPRADDDDTTKTQQSSPDDDEPPQSPRKVAAPPPPPTVQEQVRIYDMKRLTSQELEKTRRCQQQLGRAGAPMCGATDRQLTRMIADDYNEKAHRGYGLRVM